MSSLRGRITSTREWLGRFPLSILQLGMRIGVGMVFFNAGLLKYRSFEFAIKLFEDEYKVPLLAPAVAARIVMINELTASTLLFLGLATRLATLPLLGMISLIITMRAATAGARSGTLYSSSKSLIANSK